MIEIYGDRRGLSLAELARRRRNAAERWRAEEEEQSGSPTEREELALREAGDFGGWCSMCRYPVRRGLSVCAACADLPQMAFTL